MNVDLSTKEKAWAFFDDQESVEVFLSETPGGASALRTYQTMGWAPLTPSVKKSNGHSTPQVVATALAEAIEPSVNTSRASEPREADEGLQPTDMLGYLRLLFEPGDWINIQMIHQTETFVDRYTNAVRKKVADNFTTLESALEESTVASAARMQEGGWNIYVAMNAFTPGVESRQERDVKSVRTVYIEFDADTAEGLAKLDADVEAGLVPTPDFQIESSPNKAYVIWLVEGFTVPQQKALNKALQMRYGSDPASVDAARVLRLPGTVNLKYESKPVVRITSESDNHDRLKPEDFKIEYTVPAVVDRSAAPEKVQMRMGYYEQACGNAGVDAGQLVADSNGSYSYIVECPNWEEHTNKAKYDGSVWISPSGTISYRCWHSHCEAKDWVSFYRPWLEQKAREKGYFGALRFGEADEIPAKEKLTDSVVAEVESNLMTATPVVQHEKKTRVFRPTTELGNSERFVDQFGDIVRYCDTTGGWYQWQDVKWIPLGKVGPLDLMQQTVREIINEANAIKDDASQETDAEGNVKPSEASKRKQALKTWARKSEASKVITAGLQLARGNKSIRVAIDAFNRDVNLLNVANGTLDLQNNFFRAHDKNDMITKSSPVVWDPEATCPNWLKFLDKSMPDKETQRFLQQACGYTLTGNTREDCLFLNIGKGRNGKGVFMFALTHVLGDYAMTANFDSFTARNGSNGIEIRSDIARLEGARFVGASETEEETRLAEGLIKNLTGSDRITARKHYEGEREFLPQFKLWFGVNHEPRIHGVDDGIWSRIHQIVWDVFIKPEERIKNLREILQAEAPGILNWMLQGLKDYQKGGLVPSAKMKEALKAFREESDQLHRFIEAECTLDVNAKIPSSQLYAAYANWARNTKEFQLKEKLFKKNMEMKGFANTRSKAGVLFHGLTTKNTYYGSGGNHVDLEE